MTDHDQLHKEQRILETLRKVISGIVRDTTPNPGMQHPLKPNTIEDIRHCFILISAREKEITEQLGQAPSNLRPQYVDEKKEDSSTQENSKVIHFTNPNKDDKTH